MGWLQSGANGLKLIGPFSAIMDGVVKDQFIRNWLDLLCFLLSGAPLPADSLPHMVSFPPRGSASALSTAAGLPARGTITAEVAFMWAEWYRWLLCACLQPGMPCNEALTVTRLPVISSCCLQHFLWGLCSIVHLCLSNKGGLQRRLQAGVPKGRQSGDYQRPREVSSESWPGVLPHERWGHFTTRPRPALFSTSHRLKHRL